MGDLHRVLVCIKPLSSIALQLCTPINILCTCVKMNVLTHIVSTIHTRIQIYTYKHSTSQDKLRMDTLRCRAYTRQRLKEQETDVKETEVKVLDSHQQLLAVTNENRRYTYPLLVPHHQLFILCTLFLSCMCH